MYSKIVVWLIVVMTLLATVGAHVTVQAADERRLALVVGNSAYATAPLRNPSNDAGAMANKLRELGFEVMLHTDLDQRGFVRALQRFGEQLRGGGVGLFYFAGHGVQVGGENYMIPVGARIELEPDVEVEGVRVARVLAEMEKANNRLNLVILDACRDNPYARSFRSASRGLAPVNAPAGVLVAYATGPGMAAADGEGNNGLYTSELLRAMSLQGLKVEGVFKQARARVQEKSGGRQVPWESSSLVGEFYFFGPVTVVAPPAPTPGGGGVLESAEVEFWKTIKDSADPGDFDAYLKQFPKGTFAALAQKRLNALQGAKAKVSEDAAPPAKPATAGRGENFLEKAEALFYAGDFKEAANWYRQAAEQGDTRAQGNLGGLYRNGLGVAKDAHEAVKWYRQAAEQGDARAQHTLGYMYFNGQGVAKEAHEAVKWYRKAAEQGLAVAQDGLGTMYRYGWGVAKDEREARKWYRKAKERRNAQASMNRETIKWSRKVAEQGNATAQISLAYMYHEGLGVAKDAREAVKWYRKAAEQGEVVAQYNLGLACLNGVGVPKDDTEAVRWLRKARNQGYEDAKTVLDRLGER